MLRHAPALLASLGIDPNRLLRSVGVLGLFGIVFAESGVLIGFFLPGDSLLFAAGLISATSTLLPALPVLIVGCAVAAILGDQAGYAFGTRVGPNLYSRPDSRLFKQEHLRRAETFFEDHGAKTIILARFVPVVRTFAPIVAGASKMHYRTFVAYNAVGGAAWTTIMLGLGWGLGKRFPGIGDYLDVALLVVIALSLVPVAVEYRRHRARSHSEP